MAKPNSSPPYTPETLLEACLTVLEETGWREFSFACAAKKTGIPLSAFQEYFKTPADILTTLFRKIDKTVLGSLNTEDYATPKDALFDVLMTRFEAASPYKLLLKSFWQEWVFSPEDMPLLASQNLSSLVWILEAASLKARGITGLLRLQGLGMLYLLTLRVWLKDTSPDLSPTMAFLDKGLTRLEKMADFLHILGE